jgi:hypothetical protein
MSFIRRASAMECQLEQLEARFSEEGVNQWELTDLHARITSALRRLHETLGIRRVPRDVSDDSDILARHFDRPFRAAPEPEDEAEGKDDCGDGEMAASDAPTAFRGREFLS